MNNPHTAQYFSKFLTNIEAIQIPDKFTFPFYYQPHQLSLLATQTLQQTLLTHYKPKQDEQGKMFGVLVVKNDHGALGYLSAISGSNGELGEDNVLSQLVVPAVYDSYQDDELVVAKHNEINQLNQQITALEGNPLLAHYFELLQTEKATAERQISDFQNQMMLNRKSRKDIREQLASNLNTNAISEDEAKQQSIQLSRESVNDKKQLKSIKEYWLTQTLLAQTRFDELSDEITRLKKLRKKLSSKLQKQIFRQYQLLNIHGQSKDLLTLFSQQTNPIPPAGSGDCAAPKLLQYAFQHSLTPICMAEFWWGNPPKSEIRKHKQFYPSCQGKCQPILAHMLDGMIVEENPLLANPAEGIELDIVFQDEHIVVVNKPAGLLSVPGKNIQDSVQTRIKALFPSATGSMIVHRLDMATSGLLMLSLHERAHKKLQQQFIEKEVQKRYVAVIEGELKEDKGTITLPLRGDPDDRPKQLVCHQWGKRSVTEWQKIGYENGNTRLHLHPITGRTHQLRVHCAHSQGLNSPMIGDTLYGSPHTRLHLHAESLSFTHPITKENLLFEVAPEF